MLNEIKFLEETVKDLESHIVIIKIRIEKLKKDSLKNDKKHI